MKMEENVKRPELGRGTGRLVESARHLAAGLAAEVRGDEVSGLEEAVQPHPGLYPHPAQHVHHVLRRHVTARPARVRTPAQPRRAAVHHRHP